MVGAALGLIEQWIPLSLFQWQATKPSAFWGSRAIAAELTAAIIPICLARVLFRPKKYYIVLIILGVFLISTRSRVAWAGVILGAWFVFYSASTRLRRRILLAGIISIVLAAIVTPGPRLKWTHPAPYQSSLDVSRVLQDGRWRTWRCTLELIAKHPLFGTGPGNFIHAYPAIAQGRDPAVSVGQRVEDPHNLFLSVAARFGILALVVFISLLIFAMRLCSEGSKSRMVRPNLVNSSLNGALASLFLCSMFSLTYIAIPTLTLGILLLYFRLERRIRRRLPKVLLRMAATAVIFSIGIHCLCLEKERRAQRLMQRAMKTAKAGHASQAWIEIAQILQARPRDESIWLGAAAVALQAGDFRRAETAARRAISLKETNGGNLLLATIFERSNHQEEAKIYFHRALQILPNDYRALLGLARLESNRTVKRALTLEAMRWAGLEIEHLPSKLGARQKIIAKHYEMQARRLLNTL